MTKIEELVGDITILRTLLEGFLSRWDGAFNVMPVDPPPTYLFEPWDGLSEFCKKVRDTREGKALCMECDKEHARLAGERGQPLFYLCHAGMLDIAVPILVEGEPIATILCGQCRSWDQRVEKEGQKRAMATARKLGLPPSELLDLRERARQATPNEVEEAMQRLARVAGYIAATGYRMQKLATMKSEMLKESRIVQSVMTTLTTIVEVETFWTKVDAALERICEVVGADCAAIFVSEEGDDGVYRLKSVAGLSREDLQEHYPGNKVINDRVIEQRMPLVIDFDPSVPQTLCYDVAAVMENTIGRTPDKVAVIPFDLSGQQHAVMVFFLHTERDIEGSLPIAKEVEILSQAAPQFAIAYQNCVLYTRQLELARERDLFLEDLGHQLIQPLSGLQADSDRLYRFFRKWDPDRISNQILAIRSVSRWAARLTRNLIWISTEGRHAFLNRRWTKMTPLLIGCAIDMQGIAMSRGILCVDVDEESADALPELWIDRERFIQALLNLLDNAVKYAKRGTGVYVDVERVESEVRISVRNYGIPLREEDLERIFERGYRTEEAKKKVPGGTGIGLPVAREIIRLHGGELLARPSTYDEERKAHKVVFTIVLPVRPKEE